VQNSADGGREGQRVVSAPSYSLGQRIDDYHAEGMLSDNKIGHGQTSTRDTASTAFIPCPNRAMTSRLAFNSP